LLLRAEKHGWGEPVNGGAPYGRTTIDRGETIRAKLEEKQAKQLKLIHISFYLFHFFKKLST